jgi:acetoacetyl-CoA synthetase
LQSISGGTDMLGCFVLGNPNLPLYRGESQCLGLALDVREWHAEGAPENDLGELVCGTPFPSRPTMFFADPDRKRYHAAYFAQRPGLWTHGDFIAIDPGRGTARILGRSDGVLNVRGLRIGPAEITRIANEAPEIAESMAIEQRAPDEPGGSRIVLLVVLKPGATLDRPLVFRIKKELKARASASHVPAVIADVPALPVTFNNKRSERAATDAANGKPISNLVGLKNPECLDAIRNHPSLQVNS